MKKIITTLLIFVSLTCAAQKKDSVVRIELTRELWQKLVSDIDKNVDSKKASGEIFDILIKNAALVPKEEKKK